MNDHENDAGLNDLLADCIERSSDFTSQKTAWLRKFHQVRKDYEAELRRVHDGALHLRECESAVIRQLTASMPASLNGNESSLGYADEDEIARLGERFAPEPSQFMRRLIGE